jgi:hypothetical protein
MCGSTLPFSQRHCAHRRNNLKKAMFALVLLAAYAVPASTAASAEDIGGSNPRPQIAASITLNPVLQAMLAYLGF